MAATSNKKPNISFTLPISCQICLGKVKQPVICPNQHVFCTPCLDVWLRHNQLCPTCRVPITPESPCKKIHGGTISHEDKRDQQFGRALRRARVDVIFDEYETEIQRLQGEIKALRSQEMDRECHARESVKTYSSKEDDGRNESTSSSSSQCDGSREQVIQQLTVKLKEATTVSEKVKREIGELKEANNKLRDENISLSIENGRLKQSLAARSPRKYEKYAQAALKRRIDQADKEIGQLKKALTRSDAFIEEQESKLRVYQERFGDVDVKPLACKEAGIDAAVPPSGKFTLNPSLESYKDVEHTPLQEHCVSRNIISRDESSQEENVLDQRGEFVCFVSGTGRGLLTTDSGDGPSPVKRRLYLKEDESPMKGTVSQTCGYLTGEKQLDSFAHIKKSEWTGEKHNSDQSSSSSALERPSPAMLTPSSSFSKLQINKKYDSLEVEDVRLTPGVKTFDRERATTSSGPRRVPRSLTFAWNDEEDSSQSVCSDLEDEICFANSTKGERKEVFQLELNRNENDTSKLDGTLSNLDFTLTPEFVDCTKLMKEAEERVNGKQLNKGSTSSVLKTS